MGEEFVHGKVAPVQAGAEIALCEALQIDEELSPERQIEPIDVAQILRDFGIERTLGIERARPAPAASGRTTAR